MADKSHPAVPPAPTVNDPTHIRNVVLVGHTGAGKTTVVEALLHASGTIARMGNVADGTTVSDSDEEEIRQQRSVTLALAPLVHGVIKVNLLDAPGYSDFVGELRAGLRAADAALFVVSAVDDIDGVTTMLWEECAAVGMPRAIVVSKLSHQRADFDESVARCQAMFGDGVMPLHAALRDADSATVDSFIDVLRRVVVDYSGPARTERPMEAPAHAAIDEQRNALIEAIIGESEDETLMDRYLAGEDVDLATVIDDLESAVARGQFHPVLGVDAVTGLGIAEVLELMVQGFPSPAEHTIVQATAPDGTAVPTLTADLNGPLCAEVVKTTSDQYVGRISLVRVFSGRLRPDAAVHISGHVAEFFGSERGHEDHDVDERVGALSSPLGSVQRMIPEGIAGDIVAVAKLAHAETGDTLSSSDQPLLVEPWQLPEPLLPVAVVAHSAADDDKLSQALARLVAEDPTMRLESNPDTHQVVLWTMGEAHSDLLIHRLADRYGVNVEVEPVRLSLRETVRSAARGHGRHVKQSGGHGQFAICDLEVEPLPAGSGFEFVDKVVGGSVPRQFISSVEKGVRAQLAKGVSTRFPMVDVRVTLVDGKSHSVDSSDAAFQTAGGLAVRDAAATSGVDLLEPVDLVSVLIADDHVGAVMSDMAGRRGRVGGTEPVEGGRTLIKAEIPGSELLRYAIDLRSLSHGTGTFTRSYLRHEPMPRALAQSVLESSES